MGYLLPQIFFVYSDLHVRLLERTYPLDLPCA